ncbi:MAG: hypothetical protein HY465_05905 [Deltaproteobacteria bacterium]|nr:hypothetical protein [Deltaproteobacteria bacterium]
MRSQENLKKLIHLLKKLNAKLRGAPPDVPFLLDAKTITMGMNFTFTTTFGELDLLGEVDGLGQYQEVSRYAEPYDLFGHKVLVLSLDGLIKTKRAAGRPKDQLHLKELEAIRAMKRGA